MERGELNLLAAGAVVGLAIGVLLGRTLYGDMPPPAGPQVMGPAAPREAAPAGPPAAAAGSGATPPLSPEEQAAHAEIDALLARVRSDPSDREARVRLGNLTFDNGLFPIAARLYEEALALHPDDADVLTDLGIAYRSAGDPSRAREMFERAVAGAPDHLPGWYNLAVVKLVDLGDAPGAREAVEKVLAKDPSFARAAALRERAAAMAGGG